MQKLTPICDPKSNDGTITGMKQLFQNIKGALAASIIGLSPPQI